MELQQLTEDVIAMFEESFIQVNEITGYIKHGADTIMHGGGPFYVGTKKGADGRYSPEHAAAFDDLDSAKKFIDSGKKGPYKNAKGEHVQESTLHESFIDLIGSDKAAAGERFKQMMSEKVQAALGARRIELAQSLYARARGE
jgi:hypothetical protein